MNSVNGVPSDFIVLNVGGIRYQTTRTTIHKHPETMLSVLLNNTSKDAAEIFIDHDGELFRWILLWYRTGVLEPCTVAGWDATLAFYGIEVGEKRSSEVIEFVVFLVKHQKDRYLTFLDMDRRIEVEGLPNIVVNFDYSWFTQERDEIDCALKEWSLCLTSVELRYEQAQCFENFPASKIVREYPREHYNKYVIITIRKIE